MRGPLIQTTAWQDLLRHQGELKETRLADLALDDPQRLNAFEARVDGLCLNYALNKVTPHTLELLIKLALQQEVETWRGRMLAGEKINATENRSALHTALRQKGDAPVLCDGRDVIPDIRAMRERMARIVADVRKGSWVGITGKPIRHIVNIGIGGSDLGPRLVAGALTSFVSGPHVHFVANADASDLLSVLENVDAEETLFIIISKTFTTLETLLNAETARQWLIEKLGGAAFERHFIAVSANLDEAVKFGIDARHVLPLWDWVGGRTSLWSAVGIGAAMAVGMSHFERVLEGAAAMDAHFCQTPLAQNMPVLLALLGIWNINFCNARAQAVLPYSERLRDLPRYLQQLEMESNGKTVTRDGETVDYATAPVIFGECGTVGQHSFLQALHQGSQIIPADFIGIAHDDFRQPKHHKALLTNMVAQMGALAFGHVGATVPQNAHPGNRPSNLIMLDELSPYNLGMLLALYEHKVFVQSVIWNINAFDQPGVELGKKLASHLAAQHNSDDAAGTFIAKLYDKAVFSAKQS